MAKMNELIRQAKIYWDKERKGDNTKIEVGGIQVFGYSMKRWALLAEKFHLFEGGGKAPHVEQVIFTDWSVKRSFDCAPPTKVRFYTYFAPCEDCTNSYLKDLPDTYKKTRFMLAFYQHAPSGGDASQTAARLKLLHTNGWKIRQWNPHNRNLN
jgi:hypothetical protein